MARIPTDQNTLKEAGYSGDWRPRPDPTTLTTVAVDRATAALSSIFEKDIAALKTLMLAKFETVEKELSYLADDNKLLSGKIQHEVVAHQALLIEKQNVIKAEMAGMKELASALKAAAEIGIDKAFLAADKVVQSQYTAFKDTLDKTSDSIVLRISSIEHQLEIMRDENRSQSNDVKDRVTRLETARTAVSENRNETREKNTLTVVTASGIIGFFVLVVMIVGTWISIHPTSLAGASPQPNAIAVTPLSPSALAHP